MFLHVITFAFSLFVIYVFFDNKTTIWHMARPKKWYHIEMKYIKMFLVPSEQISYILNDIIAITAICLILFEIAPFYKVLLYYIIIYICLTIIHIVFDWIVFIICYKVLHSRREGYKDEL